MQNINNPEEIRIFDLSRACIRTIPVPEQINGYEYEVLACKEALEKGWKECPQMPHAETILIMELMDSLRKSWGIIYPMEKYKKGRLEDEKKLCRIHYRGDTERPLRSTARPDIQTTWRII